MQVDGSVISALARYRTCARMTIHKMASAGSIVAGSPVSELPNRRRCRRSANALEAIVSASLSCWFLAAAPSAAEMTRPVEVEVRGVEVDPVLNSPVVILESKREHKALPIWVGVLEAQAIAMELNGIVSPRPLTHDLMKRIVEELGAEVERVVIEELRENTYYATIHLRRDRGVSKIDSRPSDAIALALRFDRPIFVNEGLFVSAGAPSGGANTDVVHLWGLTLQEITARLADCLGLARPDGVLVSDVAPDAAASALHRGDVIRTVHGAAVHSLAEVTAEASSLARGATVRLGIMRDKESLAVSFKERQP